MTPISAKPSEAKVMVSNLPLLFARGSPTSLESMCLEELQVFLRFVLKLNRISPVSTSTDWTDLNGGHLIWTGVRTFYREKSSEEK